jgi:rhodanese-related sulfurtransferase
VTIIDVREPEELLSEGQIPRATNIPMNQVSFPLAKKQKIFLKKLKIKLLHLSGIEKHP